MTSRRWIACLLLLAAALLAGCAASALKQAEALRAEGRVDESLAVLEAARRDKPDDLAVRTALARQREQLLLQWLYQAEQAHARGRPNETRQWLAQADTIQPQTPRALWLRREMERSVQQERALAEAHTQLNQGRIESAMTRVRDVLSESPNHVGARALARRIGEQAERASAVLPPALAAAYQKSVSLEFRDAPLRTVFESLSRAAGVNFVFDKDVRADAKVAVFLRNVSVDEAMRVILATQQLDRKILNDSSVLVYPNTPAKQREHQELVTRSIYLANADVKQAQALVRTMAKTRDLFVDERLNLLVVRDTPEVVRLVEKLVESIDLPEPEVMLEVEVMEVASNKLDELGLKWPDAVQYGLPGAGAADVLLGARGDFRGSIANPLAVATLKGTSGATNLLANPRIRARNHEKAKVQIGERLPVFTTTSTANVGVSTSVSYLDVGLKLDVEPSVQLDNDVVIKVGLEVSNLVREVSGPQGSLAYLVGTRQTTTSLRLRDGETQIMAGLINDEDRKTVKGVPGLSTMPVLGRLFGVHSDTRNKTEVVLLITPRVLRNLDLPSATLATLPSGTDSQPGAASLRLRPGARTGLANTTAGGGSVAASAVLDAPGDANLVPYGDVPAAVQLQLSTSAEAVAGGTVSVTLSHASGATLRGELVYDALRFEPASGSATDGAGRVPFELPPQGQQVLVLRVRPDAAPGGASFSVASLVASGADGKAVEVGFSGDAQVIVRSR